MTQAKRYKVTLEVVVTSHGAILGHHEKLLILGPTQASDGTLVPLNTLSISILQHKRGYR